MYKMLDDAYSLWKINFCLYENFVHFPSKPTETDAFKSCACQKPKFSITFPKLAKFIWDKNEHKQTQFR